MGVKFPVERHVHAHLALERLPLPLRPRFPLVALLERAPLVGHVAFGMPAVAYEAVDVLR